MLTLSGVLRAYLDSGTYSPYAQKKNPPAQPRSFSVLQQHCLEQLCWNSACVLLMHGYFLMENSTFAVSTVDMAVQGSYT